MVVVTRVPEAATVEVKLVFTSDHEDGQLGGGFGWKVKGLF